MDFNFNPLHHEGGDAVPPEPYVPTLISIHSTTRVETGGGEAGGQGKNNFNPLHHEGGDNGSWFFHATTFDFNPLHHEGGDGRPEEC